MYPSHEDLGESQRRIRMALGFPMRAVPAPIKRGGETVLIRLSDVVY